MADPVADVVVVAAGRSTRMDGIDKMAAVVAGRPLLEWTLTAFASSDRIGRIVVVTPGERVPELRSEAWLPASATVVAGGARRQESVAAGVAEVERSGAPDDRVVLVHDGARPAVRPGLVDRVVEAVLSHGAAIPVVPIVETLKRIDGGRIAGTVERDGLGVAQTPQGARLGLLRTAYRRFPPAGDATFTDEAALLEACTIPVHMVPGDIDNLKVTVPADLERAGAILASGVSSSRARVGYGEDVHPFGPGEPLALGGIELAGAPRLHGHSDGDVALHAVAGALLGAAGLGDLGRLFPADARTPRGIPSAELLADVVRRLAAAGLTPTRVDVTIVGARPRLGDRLDDMAARIAQLLGVDRDAVSVKASSGNLVGMEGAGRGISARVIATVEPHP
jgi:2-C-methyl-D-erythritol 4-phosphate cytidylyltransferase / 2-C-methyl-D-erythritol 2,4-cyclodiphosphate synthase